MNNRASFVTKAQVIGMNGWNVDMFLQQAVDDPEQAQYEILGALQSARRAFSNNRIYPPLGDLIFIHKTLHTITENAENVESGFPSLLTDVDWETGEVIYEQPEMGPVEFSLVRETMLWALPLVADAIEEGKTIFDFVEDHLKMEEVGIVPSYLEEGYLFVPDPEEITLHVLKYDLSIFTGSQERYRSLRTSHLKSISQHPFATPSRSIKLSLIEERKDLPNPATYAFSCDLDFPYENTVLPVAKRKLMRHLFWCGAS